MTKTDKLGYDRFKKLAEANGVADVTQEEYIDYYQKTLDGTSAAIKRIKFYRKQDLVDIEGFAIGARDFITKDKPYEKADSIIAHIRVGDEIVQAFVRGHWGVVHGQKVQVRALRTVNKKGRESLSIKRTVQLEDRWRPDKYKGWLDISTLWDYSKPENEYPMMMVMGRVVGVRKVTDFTQGVDDDGRYSGTYEISAGNGKEPTAAVILEHELSDDRVITIEANFGPFKNAVPYIKMPGWNLAGKVETEDLHAICDDEWVGIIGEVSSTKTFATRTEPVKEINRISLRAVAMVPVLEIEGREAEEAERRVRNEALLDEHWRQEKASNDEEADVPEEHATEDVEEELLALYTGIDKGLEQMEIKSAARLEKMGPKKVAQQLIEGGHVTGEMGIEIVVTALHRAFLGKSPEEVPAEEIETPAKVTTPAPAAAPAVSIPKNGRATALVKTLIKKLDDAGHGADLEELATQALAVNVDGDALDEILMNLLDNGEAYEPTVAKIRLL